MNKLMKKIKKNKKKKIKILLIKKKIILKIMN